MAWTDRVVEYPNRVTLTPVAGQDNTYNIEANEGTVYSEGTLLNAENLNIETMGLIGGVVADAWNNSKSYNIGDSCIYNNMLWNCKTSNSNTPPTEGTYWTRVKLASADYIVDTGYNGAWYWEKWASGKAVCWIKIFFSTVSGTNNQTINYPFDIENAVAQVSAFQAGNTAATIGHVGTSDKSSLNIYWQGLGNGYPTYLHALVYGRWK